MDPPQPLTPETLWACATGPLSFFLPTLPSQPPELCSDYTPPGVLPLLFPLKFGLSFNACPTLCAPSPQDKFLSSSLWGTQPVCCGCSGFWVLSSDLTTDACPRAGPMAPQRMWEPAHRWWPGQVQEAQKWPKAPGRVFRQTFWVPLGRGLSPGWLAGSQGNRGLAA